MSVILERLLPQGVDLACIPKVGLVITPPAFDQVTGIQAFFQAITLCLTTPKGALWDLPEYGFDIDAVIGVGADDATLILACEVEVRRALSFEASRIADLVDVTITKTLNVLYVDLTMVPVGLENEITLSNLEVARVS